VASREQRRHEIVDDLVLADDPAPDLFDEGGMRSRQLVEKLDVVRIVHRLLSRCHSHVSRL
jgi:hypothetical protein